MLDYDADTKMFTFKGVDFDRREALFLYYNIKRILAKQCPYKDMECYNDIDCDICGGRAI